MTKKHFIELADAIRQANSTDQVDHFTDSQIDWLATFCKAQNANFMRDRWIAYIKGECGKNGGKVVA